MLFSLMQQGFFGSVNFLPSKSNQHPCKDVCEIIVNVGAVNVSENSPQLSRQLCQATLICKNVGTLLRFFDSFALCPFYGWISLFIPVNSLPPFSMLFEVYLVSFHTNSPTLNATMSRGRRGGLEKTWI